jgi:hypothetical protein
MATMIETQEAWPCVCTDPGHALDDDGCYECSHGKWEIQNDQWVSWYWGDRMMDLEEEESAEAKAKKAAALEMKFMQMQAAARQFETAKRAQKTCEGKIACPCKWWCHHGIAGMPTPGNGKWKDGCSIDGCMYLHPQDKDWAKAVEQQVRAGKLRKLDPTLAKKQAAPASAKANRFAGLDDE